MGEPDHGDTMNPPDLKDFIREKDRAKKKRLLWIQAGLVVAIVAMPFVGTAVLVLTFSYPTNDRDNANPETRRTMIPIALEWGQLAPFPDSVRDFEIHTEGGMFTRTFAGSFTDTADTVEAWLARSPGITGGEKKIGESGVTTYVLKMGGGANYGEVTISPGGTKVTFRVAWS